MSIIFAIIHQVYRALNHFLLRNLEEQKVIAYVGIISLDYLMPQC